MEKLETTFQRPDIKMISSNILAPNNLHFYNLAIFVCHLFIDGQFQTGHIIYDPNAIQVTQLITEIQANCSRSIPWLSTDVTKGPRQSPWKPYENTDHVLQLILFDPEKLSEISKFEKILTFYRLFIFLSTVNNDELKINEKFASSSSRDSVVLYYNPETGSINTYLLTKKHKIITENNENVQTVDDQKSEFIENIFRKNQMSEIKRKICMS